MNRVEDFVVFLNVGQGDSVLIATRSGEYILIDGGPFRGISRRLAEYMPFYERTIDTVILTHPHNDHAGGLVEVLERYNVKQILLTGMSRGDPSYLALLDLIGEKNIAVIFPENGLDYRNKGAVIDVLYPFENIAGNEFVNLNNSSLAMRVFMGELKLFLGGDIEAEVEAILVDAGLDLSADIYKANHHGSRSSNTPEFIGSVKPNTAVISCGVDNQFGHPHDEVLKVLEDNYVEVLRTDLEGSIAIYSNEANVE